MRINFYTTYLAALFNNIWARYGIEKSYNKVTIQQLPQSQLLQDVFWEEFIPKKNIAKELKYNTISSDSVPFLQRKTVIVSNKQKAGQTVKLSPQLVLLEPSVLEWKTFLDKHSILLNLHVFLHCIFIFFFLGKPLKIYFKLPCWNFSRSTIFLLNPFSLGGWGHWI